MSENLSLVDYKKKKNIPDVPKNQKRSEPLRNNMSASKGTLHIYSSLNVFCFMKNKATSSQRNMIFLLGHRHLFLEGLICTIEF